VAAVIHRRRADRFVGRIPPLRELAKSLDQARSGTGRTDIIEGEAGIGKTRLAEEHLSRAARSAAAVFRARCFEETARPELYPWTEILQRLVDTLGPEVIDALPPVLKEMASALLAGPRGLGAPPPESVSSRASGLYWMFENALAMASRITPLVVFIDDLHCADAQTLQVFLNVARRAETMRIHLLGTCRTEGIESRELLSDTLAELLRERSCRRLVLGALGDDDISAYLSAILDSEAARRVRRQVAARSRGNPFYLVHLTRYIQEHAPTLPLEMLAESDEVPEGIRQFIERRIRRLTASCDGVLAAAAVLGDEFDFHRLRGTLEECCTPEEILLGLDKAEAAGVVEPADREGQRFRFSHPLIGETLRADLPRSERLRILLRAIDAAEADRAAGTAGSSDELFHYAMQAQPLVEPQILARYALEAGRNALGRYLYERAFDVFTAGLSALSHSPAGELAAALHAGAADARQGMSIFNDPETDAHLAAALDYYAESGDTDETVRLLSHPIVSSSPEISRHCLRALEHIGNSDALARGHLLATYGSSLIWNRFDDERGTSALAEAARIAEREGDRSLELRVLSMWAFPSHRAGRFDETRSLSQRILALSGTGDLISYEAECMARYLLHDLHHRCGKMEEAEQELVRLRERTDALGDCSWGSIAGWMTAKLHLSRGAWDQVRALFAEWAYRLPGTRVLMWLQHMLLARVFSGNLGAARIRAEETARILTERAAKDFDVHRDRRTGADSVLCLHGRPDVPRSL
jgi:hypothetical protein